MTAEKDRVEAVIDELSALHVWPQSVADHHADILSPRQIKALYEVGNVATRAEQAIRDLRTRAEQAEAEVGREREERAKSDRFIYKQGTELITLHAQIAAMQAAMVEAVDFIDRKAPTLAKLQLFPFIKGDVDV